MNVTVLGTGGTIASTAGDDGAQPTKTGEELVAAVPELGALADVAVEEASQVPSYEMDAATLETIGERVRALDEDSSVDAIVVTHGTDTMAETAYYLDVTASPETPVLLTGAQRRPDETSPDGPANLLAAVRAGAAFRERAGGGTFVAFNDEIHAARVATKTHASNPAAFRSANAGPVATVGHEGVAVHRPPRTEARPLPASSLEATVFTVKSGSGVSGALVDAALERGADGIVIEGTGLGNVTAGIGDAVADAIDCGVPVVVASRCLEGRTAPVYGGDGGGRTLREHGAVFAGDLPAQKARIRLALALEAFDDGERIRDAFDDETDAFAGADSRA